MKRFLLPLISLFFLITSSLFIAFNSSFDNFIPAQQVELSHGVEYGAVLKDFLFVQEITMKQRYLSRIDVYMAKLPSQYNNSNVFVLIDNQQRILFTKRFSSADFGEALHFPFNFGKTFDIGAGKTIYACIYSTDGDQQSYIGLARKANSKLGKLYVLPILNNDVLSSFTSRQSVVDFTGTLGIRTYESDSRLFSSFRIVLYFLAFMISLIILAGKRISDQILKIRIKPAYAFAAISTLFGMIMLIITPPFQVPDEPVHFYRSYQVTEFNFFKVKDDFPASLVKLADTCKRMQFSTHEKTSRKEILSLAAIPTNPADRKFVETPDYTIPYIPQAFGIFIGKMSGLNPLWLLYLGRFFNLMVTLLLVFLAIRITPVFKWVFLLLGILPMSLYQFASLSYDAGTIGLSFLLLAWILKMAYGDQTKVSKRNLIWLFVLALLLAASKPPYFLIVFTFLIIPVSRIGSLKKYLIIFSALLLASLMVSQLWSPLRNVAVKFAEHPSRENIEFPGSIPSDLFAENSPSSHNPLAMALPMLPHAPQNPQAPAQEEGKSAVNPVASPFNPGEQKNFILSNPVAYLGILFETVVESSNLYMVSIVGLFGWIDTQLPDGVAFLYLFFLLLLALLSPVPEISIGWKEKAILLGTFLITFVLIETALYLYCNPVGVSPITAVQGRYFIAISPMLLLLFYNNKLHELLFRKVNHKSNSLKIKKSKAKNDPDPFSVSEFRFIKLLPLFAIIFAIFTLIWSVFLILDRFYILSL